MRTLSISAHRSLIFFWILFLSSIAFGSDQIPDVEMHAMTKEILTLQKFMFSEGAFLAQANDSAIKSSLEVLNRHLGYLSKGTFSEDPALRTNLALISRQISDSDRAFRAGEKSYARLMLLSGTQMCIACHTRTRSPDFVLPDADLPNASPLERADFFFATRQFEKGKEEFEKVLAEYPANHLRAEELRHVLLSLAVYFSRVKADPKAGRDFFDKQIKNKKFPLPLQKTLKAWSRDFSLWAKEKRLPDVTKTEEELWKSAKKFLKTGSVELSAENNGKYDVHRLRATVLLHQILEGPGARTPIKGEALYALGQLYQQMGYQLFFRFGEMYLKTCITEYPKTNTAQACYGALEKAVMGRYAGGSEDEVELVKLKRLAF